MDISQLSMYDLRRQAALAACRRDWQAMQDVMTFMRERVNALNIDPNTGAAGALAEKIYADQVAGMMQSIVQRDGPALGEINRELLNLRNKTNPIDRARMITIGGDVGRR